MSSSYLKKISQHKRFKILLGILLCSVAGIAAASENAPSEIDQSSFVSLGGIDQWISIRGEDRRNPVLLVVHGGPGEAQWPMAEKYKPWEKSFVVVQWDQRGTGHTYGRYGEQTPDVTLDRIAHDGVELAAYICRELGKRKIIVLGHSWGSLVAVHMVQLKPELFAAYVGTGQVSSWEAIVNTQFNMLLAKARKDNDQEKIKELEAIGHPDFRNADQYFGFSKNLMSVMAPPDQNWLKSLRGSATALRARYPKDFQDLENGMIFTGRHVLPDQIATNLPKAACHIQTAFFVIDGQDDIISPTQAAVDYFNCVKAPKKELVLIPGAGHFAFMTASDAFLTALVEKVRPIAIARGA
ncbi:MAG TPA: alpha/beta hydrolase [Candidatus Angelobacter sp.]